MIDGRSLNLKLNRNSFFYVLYTFHIDMIDEDDE